VNRDPDRDPDRRPPTADRARLALSLAATYGRGVTSVVLALLLAAAPARPDPLEARREAVANELLRLAAALQAAIEKGDAGTLLARVPEDGLRCAGRIVPKARVARDLADRRSFLHAVLFGGPAYAPPAGGAPSLRALLRDAPEVQALIGFRKDDRAGALGRPCLEFRTRDREGPSVPLCFEKRARRWWLTESLYPCG
jgi:hypothetical protein